MTEREGRPVVAELRRRRFLCAAILLGGVLSLTACGSGGGTSIGALASPGSSGAASPSATAVPSASPDLLKLRAAVDALGKDTGVAQTQGQLSSAVDQLRQLRVQSQDDLSAFYAYNQAHSSTKDCSTVRSNAAVVAKSVAPANAAAGTVDADIATLRARLAVAATNLKNAQAIYTDAVKTSGNDPATVDALNGLQTTLRGFETSQTASQQALDSAGKERQDILPKIVARSDRAATLAARCRH